MTLTLTRPQEVTLTLIRPQEVTLTFTRPQEVTLTLTRPQEVTHTLTRPQEVTLTFTRPQEVTLTLIRPQEVTLTLTRPQEVTLTLTRPREVTHSPRSWLWSIIYVPTFYVSLHVHVWIQKSSVYYTDDSRIWMTYGRHGLTTLNEPKSKGGGYWLENPYPNYCFKWLFPLLVN